MTNIAGKLRTPLCIVTLLVFLPSCMRSVYIAPERLPELNGAHIQEVSSMVVPIGPGAATSPVLIGGASASTVKHVVTLDGRTVSIDGSFRAILHSQEGDTLEFRPPVIAHVDGDRIRVFGANRAPYEAPLSTLHQVELRVSDSARSTAAATALLLLTLGAVLIVTLADDE